MLLQLPSGRGTIQNGDQFPALHLLARNGREKRAPPSSANHGIDIAEHIRGQNDMSSCSGQLKSHYHCDIEPNVFQVIARTRPVFSERKAEKESVAAPAAVSEEWPE